MQHEFYENKCKHYYAGIDGRQMLAMRKVHRWSTAASSGCQVLASNGYLKKQLCIKGSDYTMGCEERIAGRRPILLQAQLEHGMAAKNSQVKMA